MAQNLISVQHFDNNHRIVFTKFQCFYHFKDMPNAASASEITDALDLTKMTQKQWFVQATCATTGEGIVEGLEWLAQKVKEKKRNQKY